MAANASSTSAAATGTTNSGRARAAPTGRRRIRRRGVVQCAALVRHQDQVRQQIATVLRNGGWVLTEMVGKTATLHVEDVTQTLTDKGGGGAWSGAYTTLA